jgi:hypothetical protein
MATLLRNSIAPALIFAVVAVKPGASFADVACSPVGYSSAKTTCSGTDEGQCASSIQNLRASCMTKYMSDIDELSNSETSIAAKTAKLKLARLDELFAITNLIRPLSPDPNASIRTELVEKANRGAEARISGAAPAPDNAAPAPLTSPKTSPGPSSAQSGPPAGGPASNSTAQPSSGDGGSAGSASDDGAAGGANSSAAAGGGEPQVVGHSASADSALSGSMAKGAKSATKMADALKNGLNAADTIPGPKNGAGGGARPGGFGVGGQQSSHDPSSPTTPRDLALAEGPYKNTFTNLGLHTGPSAEGGFAVFHNDGKNTPASREEIAKLGQAIRQEPTALMRDPSFLSGDQGGISRERFGDLKKDYATRPDLRDTDFKHVGLADNRDFKRTESCDVVSGQCNPHAKKSYRKGDDVPSKELENIWSSINKYADAVVKQGGQRRTAGGSGLSGIGARMRSLLSRMSPFGSASNAGGLRSYWPFRRASRASASNPRARPNSGASRSKVVVPTPSSAADAPAPAQPGNLWYWILGALAALSVLFAILVAREKEKRRRRTPAKADPIVGSVEV